jgi:hypothetical protein
MLIAIAVLVFAMQNPRPAISLHTPETLPPSLKGAKAIESFLGSTSVGNYRAVESKFVIQTPAIPLCRKLQKELTKWFIAADATDAQYKTRGGVSGFLELPDRRLFVRVELGREVVKHQGNSYTHEFLDADKYSTVLTREVPHLVGLVPARWPKEARLPVKLPNGMPPMPLKMLNRKPNSIRLSVESGGLSYHLTWAFHGSSKTAFPRYAEDLRAAGGWRVPSEKSEWECRPLKEESWENRDKKPRLVRIRFADVEEAPGWNSVSVTVFDPNEHRLRF